MGNNWSWKNRVLRTDAEFRNFGNRVLVYEVVELLNSQRLLVTLDFSSEPTRRVKNALVESSAIHSRNLIEFLYFSKSRVSDVRASDFGVNWTSLWQRKRNGPLGALCRRASKQVAHVTAGRLGIRRREKSYNHRATSQLLREFGRFVIAAQARQHGRRIGRDLASAAQQLQ